MKLKHIQPTMTSKVEMVDDVLTAVWNLYGVNGVVSLAASATCNYLGMQHYGVPKASSN